MAQFHSSGPAPMNSKYRKIADGVVHFRLRCVAGGDPAHVFMQEPTLFRGQYVPILVEVEFGLVEEGLAREMVAQTEDLGFWPRVKKQKEIMEKNLHRVHMFRQIVPIRNSRN